MGDSNDPPTHIPSCKFSDEKHEANKKLYVASGCIEEDVNWALVTK